MGSWVGVTIRRYGSWGFINQEWTPSEIASPYSKSSSSGPQGNSETPTMRVVDYRHWYHDHCARIIHVLENGSGYHFKGGGTKCTGSDAIRQLHSGIGGSGDQPAGSVVGDSGSGKSATRCVPIPTDECEGANYQ